MLLAGDAARCSGCASGMQGLVTAYGGTVVAARAGARRRRARSATTARASSPALPQGFAAVRYHSLGAVAAAAGAGRDGVERGRRGDGRAPPRPAARGRAVPPRVDPVRARRRRWSGTSSRMTDPVSFFLEVAARHPRCFWLDGGGAREWSGRRSIIGWLEDDDVSLSWSAARREVRRPRRRDVDGGRRRRLRRARGADAARASSGSATSATPRAPTSPPPPDPALPDAVWMRPRGGAGVRARGASSESPPQRGSCATRPCNGPSSASARPTTVGRSRDVRRRLRAPSRSTSTPATPTRSTSPTA